MGSCRLFINWLIVTLLLLAAIILHLIWGYREYYAHPAMFSIGSSIHDFKRWEPTPSAPSAAVPQYYDKPASSSEKSPLTFNTEEVKTMFSNAPPEEKAGILLSKIDSLSQRLKTIEEQYSHLANRDTHTEPIQISSLLLQALKKDRTITQQAHLINLFQVSFHLKSDEISSGELTVVVHNATDEVSTHAGGERGFYYDKKVIFVSPDQRINFSFTSKDIKPGIYTTDVYYGQRRIASTQNAFR